MAQATYTPISLYHSTTAAAVPTAGNLVAGELALNTVDEKLYFKNSAGTVKLLASNATSAPVLSFSAGTTGFTPSTATTGVITLAGTLGTANGGTGLGGATPFTSGGVVYASSTSALATGTQFVFDGTNVKIGVHSFAPNTNLAGNLLQLKTAGGIAYLTLGNGDGANQTNYIGSASDVTVFGSVTDAGATTERMRLTSTGLGIGTSSPAYKLDVDKGSTGFIARFKGGTASAYIYGDNSSVYLSSDTSVATAFGLNENSDYLTLTTAGTERVRVDSAGNLGLGVTPSAWLASRSKMEFSSAGTTAGFVGCFDGSGANNQMGLGSNCYLNASSNWIYSNSGGAGRYQILNNAHSWLTAPSGTAGNPITFTQAMTLDASGQLALGQAGPILTSTYTGKLSVYTAGGANVVAGGGSNTTDTVMSRIVGVNQNNGNSGNTGANEFQGITSIETALVTSNSNVSGDSGGYLMFKTKADAGALTERLRIAANGAFGLSGANYGTNGQVLTSGGSGAAPTWTTVGGGSAATPTALGTVYGSMTTTTEKTFLGYQAGNSNSGGDSNNALGYRALYVLTSGYNNNAFGTSALESVVTGINNSAFGTGALRFTTGNQNSAFGDNALYTNTTANANTGVGYRAGYNNTTGGANTFVGRLSAFTNTTGAAQVAVGNSALYSNSTGSGNVAVGDNSLANNTTASNNVAIGRETLYDNTTGTNLTATGTYALTKNTTADNNTAVGYYAAGANTTGSGNTAIGTLALRSNTTGTNNIAIGDAPSGSSYGTLHLNTTGTKNVAIGTHALLNNTTASYSTAVGYQAAYSLSGSNGYTTAIGYQALYTQSTGYSNTAVGYQSGYAMTTGIQNSMVGIESLKSNTTGSYNSAFGTYALNANISGNANVAMGHQSLLNSVGSNNTALGYQSLPNNQADSNTAVGYQAAYSTTTGYNNVAMGWSALKANTTGLDNIAIGSEAKELGATGNSNICIGRYAARSTTGSNNVAVGDSALFANTTASDNTAVGYQALYSNTTGTHNTAVGWSALKLNTGTDSCAMGYGAGANATTGGGNTFIGRFVGNNLTTGTGNSFVGDACSYNSVTTGSYNTFLGGYNQGSGSNAQYQIVIGYNIVGQADSNVTIGSPSGKIYNAFTSNATWTQTSDGRLKTNVQDDSLGLSFINRLRPVKFNWKPSNEIDQSLPQYGETNIRNTETVIHGLIAQEVKAALDAEGVNTFAGWDVGSDGIQAISREMFISPLIKAIQEQQAIIESLKARLDAANL